MYVTSTRYFDRLSAEQLRVLVAEPKELLAARLKTQLERLGHLGLGPAKDGQEAVAVAQRLHPSLVLIDSKLPGGDGIETARAIVAERPVPVILLTDYPGAELVRRAKEAGVVAYLSPVERRPLLPIIEVALKRFDELRIVQQEARDAGDALLTRRDRKSTRLNSSHGYISYAVFCLKKKKTEDNIDNNTYQTTQRCGHPRASRRYYR